MFRPFANSRLLHACTCETPFQVSAETGSPSGPHDKDGADDRIKNPRLGGSIPPLPPSLQEARPLATLTILIARKLQTGRKTKLNF